MIVEIGEAAGEVVGEQAFASEGLGEQDPHLDAGGFDAKMVAIHLRETRSMMAYAYLAATQRSNWLMSQHHS